MSTKKKPTEEEIQEALDEGVACRGLHAKSLKALSELFPEMNMSQAAAKLLMHQAAVYIDIEGMELFDKIIAATREIYLSTKGKKK